MFSSRQYNSANLTAFTSLFIVMFCNVAFFRNLVSHYPINSKQLPFILSTALILFFALNLVLTLICVRHSTKPVLILVLMLSSGTAYFMDSYNSVIDSEMIRNALYSDWSETSELLSLRLMLYVVALGVLPALLVVKAEIMETPRRAALKKKTVIILASLAFIAALFFTFNKAYFSFIKTHKILRYYSNPGGALYGGAKYLNEYIFSINAVHKPIGLDAKIPETDTDRELVVLVVGETVRADHFSLNGYKRNTNPLLEKEDLINFSNMTACGTSTAVSVPCMFSILTENQFSFKEAESTDNLLDVLTRAGVHVLWRDNNSDSKGVAMRVPYQDYRTAESNPVCDVECRDEGMLADLQEYVDQKSQGDIFIVLHQMGNHGPAYHKRYPSSFEKFQPACKTNQLESCTREEIVNAYDNAILYTDSFLKKTIDLLRRNSGKFETALFYVSDHGESLGENGLYLHGLPYAFAPKSQTHVASFLWFGDSFRIDKGPLRTISENAVSHDNVFHTVLGLMEIETNVYNKRLDLLSVGPW